MKRSDRHSVSGILLIACLMGMSSCSDDSRAFGGGDDAGMPINISGSYGTLSRASDAGFADRDMMGVFITDYSGETPGQLSDKNIHAANVKFTHEGGAWTGATQLYWTDDKTAIDVYGYYPFDAGMSAPEEHSFRVAARQDETASGGQKGAYERSDFLWAKATRVSPTSQAISLSYSHAMAGVTIRLTEGSGFASGEFAKVSKNVWISNTVTTAKINLGNQSVEKTGDAPEKIYPLVYNGEYRAVVVPQTVEGNNELLGLTVDGRNYTVSKTEAVTYLSGKMHTFNVTIDKKSDSGDYEVSLSSDAITAWVDDPDFHDGLVYQYITVKVESAGTLKQTMTEQGLKYEEISALKVCGPMNAEDREFIGALMTNCNALNAADAEMVDDKFSIEFVSDDEPEYETYLQNIYEKKRITHIVYPKKPFKKLGWLGGLTKGASVIPEGVEEIDGWSPAIGEKVELPSTVKKIGHMGDDEVIASGLGIIGTEGTLRGELRLPDGLESYEAIMGYFSGTLLLPQSLKSIGIIGGGNFAGGLVIPQGIKEIPAGAFERVSFAGTLELPEGLEVIFERSFGNDYFRYGEKRGCGFTGELVLPESLKEIGSYSFASNKFTKIIWPKNLTVIGEGAFGDNNRLQGTLTLPEKVEVVSAHAFQNCGLLTKVELHADIAYIGEEAFSGCERLTSVVCTAENPPLISESSFNGVDKSSAVLEVPASAVAAYKSAPGWKEFKRIKAYGSFVCSPAQIQALNKQKVQSVTVFADGAWEVKSKPDWCEVNPTSGTGKTTVEITVKDLPKGGGNRPDGSVEFALTGKDGTAAVEIHQFDFEADEDAVKKLQTHSKGNGIPIYFIGDGWTGGEMAEYMRQCEEDMEHFFGIQPYKRLRQYFDVYACVALSQESGVNTVYTYRDTRFGTIYTAGTQSLSCSGVASQLIPDEGLIKDYLTEAGVDLENLRNKGLVILVPNVTDYSSATYFIDGMTVSICPPTTNPYPMDNRGIVQHEACGHGFGRLGDELISRNAFATSSVKQEVDEKHQWEWFMNLSTTSNMKVVPWAEMIFDPRYSDRVDVFEGGYGYTRGIFRSEANSCMNLGIPYFNSISRLYITKRILETAGVGFDKDDFYTSDSFEWGSGEDSRSGSAGGITEIPGHREPAFMSGSENRRMLKELRARQKK